MSIPRLVLFMAMVQFGVAAFRRDGQSLARAFVVRPAVLLADEPTGSLDHATGETVMQLMFELNREAGTTLVLVTHDEQLASRCSRTLRLDSGRLVSA